MRLNELVYGIVGLGIMGGSIAKSIRENIMCEADSSGSILGCNRSLASLKSAISDGIIDEAYASDEVDAMLEKCDVVFICLYPNATLDFLREHKAHFKSDSFVTDISGVKGIFEKSLPEILRPDVDFIIGHPMAGGEKEGYAASSAKFFIDHNYILVPQDFNRPENLETMKRLISAMGFSRIMETTCETHDYRIAFTSQLCHVIASALVQSSPDTQMTSFGGGSFEDLTRIAMINAPLWTELFIMNSEKLVGHIDNFVSQIETMKKLIQTASGKELTSYLEQVRDKRISMGSIQLTGSK